MGVNDFDFIAPIYDRLGKVVFKDQLFQSQIHFLNQITQEDKVLILGGGSGKLLELFSVGCHVDFLEKSLKMMHIAQSRSYHAHVNFINADFLQARLTMKYDVIVAPFFLDCFGEESLKQVVIKLKEHLENSGILIVTDFQKPTSLLVRLMHVFFRLVSRLESKKLKNLDQCIRNGGFTMREEKFFYRNMIFSRVYGNL